MAPAAQLALIARALDFVERELKSPIGVADMAQAVDYSLYHFCRTFNRATHQTPYDYLMRRRLAKAARHLLGSGRKVIDVAFDYHFSSAETFSRAFRRVYGMSPSEFRRGSRVPWPGLMPRLTLAHLSQISLGGLSEPTLMEWGSLSLTGMMTHVKGDLSAVSELWELLTEELARHERGERGGDFFGVSWFPPDWEKHGRLYLAAVDRPGGEIERSGPLVSKRVPAHHYARFIHKGETERVPLTLDTICHTWLPRSGCSLALPLVVERYGPAFRDGPESEREIWIPVTIPARTGGRI